jgi:hypothetical protein
MSTALLSTDDISILNQTRRSINSQDIDSVALEIETNHPNLPVHIKERLLTEFSVMLSDPGTYLIDESTGSVIFKISAEMLVQYPDLKREDGRLVSRDKTLHPKFTSALALSRHHQTKLDRVIRDQPFESVEHIVDPKSILREAKTLTKKTYANLPVDSETDLIEIGRENVNGIFQAFNPKFIRTNMYGAQLAKVLDQIEHPNYEFLGIKMRSNYKEMWYEVLVRIG